MKTRGDRLFLFLVLNVTIQSLYGQGPYYPDLIWQTRKPEDLKMNEQLLDGAVNFAIQNETKIDYDL